jgi:hypothetical protein
MTADTMMLGAIDRTGSDGTSILCTGETTSRTASTESYFVMNINWLNEQSSGSTAVKDVYHPEKSSSLEIRTRRNAGRTQELGLGTTWNEGASMIPFFSSDTDITIKVYGVHANMCTVHCLKRHGLLERAALVERSTSLRGTKCHILQSNVPPSFDTSIY